MARAVVFALLLLFMSGFINCELECEDLPAEDCAFAVSSSGARCVLENQDNNLQCKTSMVMSARKSEWVESEECLKTCGVEKLTVGMSTDALLDKSLTSKLCTSNCELNCHNVFDFYLKLSAKEGIYLPSLCKAQNINENRKMKVDPTPLIKPLENSEPSDLETPAPAPAPVRQLRSFPHPAVFELTPWGQPVVSPGGEQPVLSPDEPYPHVPVPQFPEPPPGFHEESIAPDVFQPPVQSPVYSEGPAPSPTVYYEVPPSPSVVAFPEEEAPPPTSYYHEEQVPPPTYYHEEQVPPPTPYYHEEQAPPPTPYYHEEEEAPPPTYYHGEEPVPPASYNEQAMSPTVYPEEEAPPPTFYHEDGSFLYHEKAVPPSSSYYGEQAPSYHYDDSVPAVPPSVYEQGAPSVGVYDVSLSPVGSYEEETGAPVADSPDVPEQTEVPVLPPEQAPEGLSPAPALPSELLSPAEGVPSPADGVPFPAPAVPSPAPVVPLQAQAVPSPAPVIPSPVPAGPAPAPGASPFAAFSPENPEAPSNAFV